MLQNSLLFDGKFLEPERTFHFDFRGKISVSSTVGVAKHCVMGSSFYESLPLGWRTICTKGHAEEHTWKCFNWISPQVRKNVSVLDWQPHEAPPLY